MSMLNRIIREKYRNIEGIFLCPVALDMSVVSEIKGIWDIPLDNLFPMVLEFYRNEKDHVVLDYGQRVKLLAFHKQEKMGPYATEKDADTGYFDVMGSDRRKAWKALGNMTQEEARHGLISLLDAATPKLREFVLERWKAQKKLERNEKEKVDSTKTEQQQETKDLMDMEIPAPDPRPINGRTDPVTSLSTSPQENRSESKSVLAPAALWCTPKAAQRFIDQVKGSPNCHLVIGAGESVAVQVPTTTEASAIFWEFVTASGDVGFGLRFQRKSEAEDTGREWPIEELLPVVRRNCSEDLILGSHQYQSAGTYFLQFDNVHSVQSSAVVYYKVFYQKTA